MTDFLSAYSRAVRERNRRAKREADGYDAPIYTCSDCGKDGARNYTAVPTTRKMFCTDCSHRRQHDNPAYLFDPRSWAEIAQAREQGAA